MRNILYLTLLTLILIACNKDDTQNKNDESIEMTCSSIEEIDEVTVSNVSITVADDGAEYGYFVRATITNNTDAMVKGKPIFQFSFSNDDPLTLIGGPIRCNKLPENSTCDYEEYVFIGVDITLDPNPTINCFGYRLD